MIQWVLKLPEVSQLSCPSCIQLSRVLLGLLVCRIEEEHLWESKQLGAHSPNVLLNTLVYFNMKHFMLRTSQEHLALSFSHIMKHWKKTSSPSGKQGRSVYLRYYSPAQNSMYSSCSIIIVPVVVIILSLFHLCF